MASNLVLVEEKIAAKLGAFDCYYNVMKQYLNPSSMQEKFISVGLVDGSIIGGGEVVFQPDHIKMEAMLKEVRNSIQLNGPENFGRLVRALNSVPAHQNLASQLYIVSYCINWTKRYQCYLEKHSELKNKPTKLVNDKNTAKGLQVILLNIIFVLPVVKPQG